jgi:hypothetical protein
VQCELARRRCESESEFSKEVSRADMASTSPTSTYVLGSTEAEHQRLIRRAAILAPFTERLFRDAGIGPG